MKFYDDSPLETDEDYNFMGGGFRRDASSLLAVALALAVIVGGIASLSHYVMFG